MKSLLTLGLGLGLATSGILSAATVTWNATDANALTNPGVVFSSVGSNPAGNVVVDTKNGLTFVGIETGGAGDEVDFGQVLGLSFNLGSPVRFESLTLGLLFNGPEYSDNKEIAIATTSGLLQYRLQVIGEDTATWSVWNGGSYDLLDTINNGGGSNGTQLGLFGLFTITNPFQNEYLTGVQFTAGKAGSDYGVVGFTAQVPDSASTLSLFGLALIAFAGIGRRIKA